MRNNLTIILVTVAMLTIAPNIAFGASTTNAKPLNGTPVRVGFVTELSGAGAGFGQAALQAAKLAVQQINEAGGVLDGRPIKLVVGDDHSDPRVAKEVWKKIVNENVAAMIFRETSASRVAVVPVAESEDIPAIYANTYEGGACSPILYVAGVISPMKNLPFLKFLKSKGAKSIFYLGSDYNYPRILLKQLKPLINKLGMKLVGSEFAPFGTTNYLPIISKIRNSGANTLFLALVGAHDNSAFYKQARSRALMQSLKLVASDQLDDTTLAAVGNVAKGTYADAGYFTTLNTPENKKFIAALAAKYGSKALPQSQFSEPSFDSLHLYALAVNKAGTAKTGPVLKALSEVSFVGPKGKVHMTADRHTAMPVYVAQAQADGKYKVLKSFGIRTPSSQCPNDMPFGMPKSGK